MANVLNNVFKASTSTSRRFCDDEILQTYDEKQYSYNQALAGPANPRTLVPPVLIAPPLAFDFWRKNALVKHTRTNDSGADELYLSGFIPANCCDKTPCLTRDTGCDSGYGDSTHDNTGCAGAAIPSGRYIPADCVKRHTSISYDDLPAMRGPAVSPSKVPDAAAAVGIVEGFDETESGEQQAAQYLVWRNHARRLLEDSEMPVQTQPPPPQHKSAPTCAGIQCQKLIHSKNVGAVIEQQPTPTIDLDNPYDVQLATQTLQPGAYFMNDIQEPILSNLGISWNQQNGPFIKTPGGRYVELPAVFPKANNRIIDTAETKEPTLPSPPVIGTDQVYDPRLSGYGSDNRTYIDPMTGQPRFMYTDVDAARAPNYITRNNIDFTQYGDSYGPVTYRSSQQGNPYTNSIRPLAENTFLQESLTQRDELMVRLMAKRNSEMFSVRKYPKNTSSQYMLGGMGRVGF